MKFLIHGRKNGYTVLYPRPTPTEFYSFASDLQSISANNYEVYYGKNFYTIAFVDSGCVFTKYVIGNDVERGQLGEIGISIYIPKTYRLSGSNVKELLDKLIYIYEDNYIYNNNIDEPKSGFNWSLFYSLVNDYDERLESLKSPSNINEIVTTGTKDPAIHYYKSGSELKEHFDKPFQEEYKDYKQILFIDDNLQGASNPLNVLKNSGIEVNPDLKNEYLYLHNYDRSKSVKIYAYYDSEWNERSDKKSENHIRSKWKIKIRYSKDYYNLIEETGSISDPASGIYKYLEISGSSIKIKYDDFRPVPQINTILFNVVKKNDGKKVDNAEIKVDNQPWEYLSEVTFIAEELGKKHIITARKEDENLFSEVLEITPINYHKDSILLALIEKRIVKIEVEDENGNSISNFRVHVTEKNVFQVTDEIVFVGDEIYRYWNIQIQKREGYIDSENKKLYPANDGSEIKFILKKVKRDSHNSNINEYCDDSYNGKKENKKIGKIIKKIVFIILGFVILFYGICALLYFMNKAEQPEDIILNESIIEKYVESDSIMPERLEEYKVIWKKQEQGFIKKSGFKFFGGKENVDSVKWKSNWKPAYVSIEQAIIKRNLINKKSFAELKKLSYSPFQQSFKKAFENIDSTRYTEIGEKLKDVSALTLTQIADSINFILSLKEQEKQQQPQETNKEDEKPKQKKETSSKIEQTKEQPKLKKHGSAPLTNQETNLIEKTSVIIQYIRGSELDEAKLNEYKNTRGINQNLKKSIQLCLDFWSLDGSGSGKKAKTYWTFQDKVNEDKNFNNSKIKAFLDKICQDGVSLSYSKQDKKKGLK